VPNNITWSYFIFLFQFEKKTNATLQMLTNILGHTALSAFFMASNVGYLQDRHDTRLKNAHKMQTATMN
jgi:hypothetical protein